LKILQINTTVNIGSHGRIAEDIGSLLQLKGHQSFIAFGRGPQLSSSSLVKIGNHWDIIKHVNKTRLFDRHGFGSEMATKKLISEIEQISPDIIQLHNLHGYYINITVLFNYLKKVKIPIVWTFHDCWPFTGHCSYFDNLNCYKWQRECHACPKTHAYPESWFIDRSRKNFQLKKELFTGLENTVLVSPSEWLAGHLHKSFLSNYEIRVINNGIDLERFRSVDIEVIKNKYNLNRKYILGVASKWSRRKGLKDFKRLRKILSPEIEIVLLGLSQRQLKLLPKGIKGICHTENINELAAFYSGAEVFVDPTYLDNFPTTNIEALACGTPVITYNTGGSPETINEATGFVVNKGDLPGLVNSITTVLQIGKQNYSSACRKRAENLFDKNARFCDYNDLYQSLIEKQ
jgi:glycosyltransferase involved in cell wall biosynthesis